MFSNTDRSDGIVSMADGRFIKLQPKARGGSGLPDMRLILNWDLPGLIATQP